MINHKKTHTDTKPVAYNQCASRFESFLVITINKNYIRIYNKMQFRCILVQLNNKKNVLVGDEVI